MAQMTASPLVRELAWGALALGITALVIHGAAWSYPQGADDIRWVGAATMLVIGVLCARDAWRVADDRGKV